MFPPTTARPKTSAGHRAATARGFRRPSTSSHANERPQSRAGMVSDAATSERQGTRAGVVPQSSAGKRMPSRVGTDRTQRPPTASRVVVPPKTAARPVTQQGLAGVRPSSRLATMHSRQVIDKSYYMSLLRAKMNALVTEIDNLRREVEKGEHDRQEVVLYEKRAEEEAEKLQELHGKLVDLNVVVDHLHSNSETAVEEELRELRMRNDEMEEVANDLFAERKENEAEVEETKRLIEAQKAANMASESEMDPKVREEIEQLKAEVQQVYEEYQLKNLELAELCSSKDALDEDLANSALKRRATEMHEQLAEIEAKKAAILTEVNEETLPEQLREQLLQTVLRTSGEIAVIDKQIEAVNEKIEQCNEELREFANDFEDAAGEKSVKYRELKITEIQYDEFLNDFENRKTELEDKIAETSAAVVRYMSAISLNCAQIDQVANVTTMDITSIGELGDEAVSANELQDLHVRLQEEMINLSETERKLKQELENAKQKMKEMEKKIASFGDMETLKSETEAKRKDLEDRRQDLERRLPEAEKECQEAQELLTNATAFLSSSDEYQKLKVVERKLHAVEQSKNALHEEVKNRRAKTDYLTLKEEAMRFKEVYNEALVERIKGN